MSKDTSDFKLSNLELGKPTEYRTDYSPDLLQAVPRALNRAELGVVEEQPFCGVDVWHGYELSWLNEKGKPIVALVRCAVPSTSPNIVESKSFKLYLNSYNQSKFIGADKVKQLLQSDLSGVAGAPVKVELFEPDMNKEFNATVLPGKCLDELDIEIDDYDLNPRWLQQSLVLSNQKPDVIKETLHSHLLKSNCLITNQPDWASVVIDYHGESIEHESLLRYLISFRMHNEFHEQCVERIFMDLYQAFKLDYLSVQAFYTRRGGLDINPKRSTNENQDWFNLRTNRQ
ncbi:MAG: NADPH-dependent 7-cyano-7-deazaguanine reductase QueF [Acidiferrobacterales bacterium]|nr:NADPH-dependent 7-cyano-7-deazaguanine reductase QueF [Acidiferrobacterales bacterium]